MRRNGAVERSLTASNASATTIAAPKPTACKRVANARATAPSTSAWRASEGSRRHAATAQAASVATG